jgi:hypothetical protein
VIEFSSSLNNGSLFSVRIPVWFLPNACKPKTEDFLEFFNTTFGNSTKLVYVCVIIVGEAFNKNEQTDL